MFEGLSDRLSGVFDRLSGRGVLTEKDIDAAMREVRVALLEADVALPVVREFIEKARQEALGEAVIRSVKPADQVIKIVHDGLVDMLGGADTQPLRLALNPPTVLMVAGLQGSGKTTLSAKIALRLSRTERKRVLMASLDVRRPAAMEQLAILGKEAGVDTLPILPGQAPADIARRAISAAKLGGFDVLILDTAGRTTLDEAMMSEAAEIARIASPTETLLVADSLTGQDAVRTAKAFHERLPLTGLVLTRADGDARAARAVGGGAQHRARRGRDAAPRGAAAGDTHRPAGPAVQHARSGEEHVAGERGGAAGTAVRGAAGAERDLQPLAHRRCGDTVLRRAVAVRAAAEPAGATRGAAAALSRG